MFTDIHHHLIWGVDDGARNREETFRMVDESVADGVEAIFATSHITPGEMPFDTEGYEDHFRQTEEYIREKGYELELFRGNEVLYTDHTARMLQEKRVMPLGNSRYVLTEFVPDDSYERLIRAGEKIRQAGYVMVVAHAERYFCLKRTGQIRELKEETGALIQVNARSVLRKQPLLRRHFFAGMFREGLVDFVASDTHSYPGRKTCLTEAYEVLQTQLGQETANKLFYGNQTSIKK